MTKRIKYLVKYLYARDVETNEVEGREAINGWGRMKFEN
jgi:hypothetical protein